MPRYLIPAGTLIILLAVFFLLPVTFPHRITSTGKIYPASEWLVTSAQDEGVETYLHDHVSGEISHITLNRFERGDAIIVDITLQLDADRLIEAGDTVAILSSSELSRQLTTLKGSLASTRATYQLYKTGEKPSVIYEEEMNLARAREQAAQHNRELERIRILRASQSIAQIDLEIAESQQRVYDADIALAEARLAAVSTGSKKELVDVTTAQIAAIEAEIESLESQIALYTIVSPISGRVLRPENSDTLITVRDTQRRLVVTPIPLKDLGLLAVGESLNIYIPGIASHVQGRWVDLGQDVQQLNGEEVVLAKAVIEPSSVGIINGALVECTLLEESLTLRGYVSRFFKGLGG